MMFLKILFFLGIFYLGFRIITKPFRDVIKQMKSQMNEVQNKHQKEPKASKTDDIGEYIDYEEVE